MNIKPYKKNGKTYYKFSIYLGKDPLTGKEKRTNRQGFKSKQEAKIEYAKLLQSKEDIKNQNYTFEEVYKDWLNYYKNTVKESTLRSIITTFKLHVLPVFSKAKIKDITIKHIQDYVLEQSFLRKNYKIAISCISQVFKFAINQGYIDKNPCDNIIYPTKAKAPESKPVKAWDREELNKFLLALEEEPIKWKTLLYLIAMTGIRRGEALGLHWDCVDFTESKIIIKRNRTNGLNGEYTTTPKTNSSLREIFLDDKTTILLKQWKMSQSKIHGFSDIVFTNSKADYIVLSHPIKVLDRIIKKNNLKRITIHGLRHTHTSLLVQAGVPLDQVMDRLGHDDVTTTLEIYNHVSQEEKKSALNNLIELMS